MKNKYINEAGGTFFRSLPKLMQKNYKAFGHLFNITDPRAAMETAVNTARSIIRNERTKFFNFYERHINVLNDKFNEIMSIPNKTLEDKRMLAEIYKARKDLRKSIGEKISRNIATEQSEIQSVWRYFANFFR